MGQFKLLRFTLLRQATVALNYYTIHFTRQTSFHLTSCCFLNSNLTCVVAILRKMMRAYLLSSVYDQHGNFFRNRIVMLKQRWSKCIDVKWDYIEKYWKTLLFLKFLGIRTFLYYPRICLYAWLWISVLACIIVCITEETS